MASERRVNGQFRKGISGNPSGLRKDAVGQVVRTAQQRSDDWHNFFTGLGIQGRDKRMGTHFSVQTYSFDQLKDLYLCDDLAARAVEVIPREAWRQGYDLTISTSNDDTKSKARGGLDPHELSQEVQDKLDVLGADDYLEVCGRYERAYGGGAILIGANDGEADLTKPLNLNRVRSIDWLTPLEAREIMPLYAYNDPRQPKYGQPEIYQLMSRAVLPSYSGNYFATTQLIHESRLVVFPGIRVSRYQQMTARGGWGESVLTRVYRVLRDFNQAWASAGVLVTDFAQSVIKIAGLWEALSQDGSQSFQNRLAAMEYGRAVTNAVTIDAGDEYSRQQTPLTGLPDLLKEFAIRVAAACDMPITLLFGISPAGLNATGESDIRLFYDRVAAYQRRVLVPKLRQIVQIIFRTIGGKREPDKWSLKFRPLWQESAKDKATAMFTQAQADNIWITAGVLSPEEVAVAHWGKGEYNPDLSVDFEAREDQEMAAPPTWSQEDEDALDPDKNPPPGGTPPPGPGSAVAPQQVPAPGPASAPDPSTPPKVPTAKADSRARDAQSGYVPPPEPGTASAPALVPAPGPASAPDPNTPPVNIVKAEDAASSSGGGDPGSVGMSYRPGETQPSEVHPSPDPSPLPPRIRDERSRFAGTGYGLPLPEQAVARGGHERMASDMADSAERHAKRARDLQAQAQGHAMAGKWTKFEKAQRDAMSHTAKAARDAAVAGSHAARANTQAARDHAARAAGALARRDSIDAGDMVYQQLLSDYPPEAISWVRGLQWTGPEDVPLDQIDFHDKDDWRAAREPDQVAKHEQKIAGGKRKPIILVRRPVGKMFIADGHHRATAYHDLDVPARAWVALVHSDKGPWDAMHDSQRPKRSDATWQEYDEARRDDDERPVAERSVAGVEVCIEVEAGDVRQHAFAGPITMPCDYGYIKGVKGPDGDSLDAFVGDPDSDRVFVIQQLLPRGPGEWKYYQDKVMLGFDSEEDAKRAFADAHGMDGRYMGGCREIAARDLIAVIAAASGTNGQLERQLSGIVTATGRQDAWSDEARAAALEARRASARAKAPSDPSKVSSQKLAAITRGEMKAQRATHTAHVSGKPVDHAAAAEAWRKSGDQHSSAGMSDQRHYQMAAEHEAKAHSSEAPTEHGEGGPKSEQSHPAGSEGKHGGEHVPDGHEADKGKHGEGHGGHGHGEGGKGHGEHGHEKSEFGKGLGELAKTVGETVAGEKAFEVAGQLAPVGGEGEGGEE